MENVMPRVLNRDNNTSRNMPQRGKLPAIPVIPAMKSKSRVLSNVINKDVSRVGNSKEAVERQRANASKLSSGFSVVHQNAGKENAVTNVANKKPVKTVPKPQPAKPNAKKIGVLEKKASVASLYSLEEMKIKEPEPLPVIRIQSAEITSSGEPTDELCSHINEEDDTEAMNSEFLLGMYAKDIYKFLRYLESCQVIRKGYLTPAHIMTHNMRALLVDWLFEVQQSFKLLNETVQLAIALLDRFMQDNPSISKNELQLVGVTCIFLASKYEEMYPPDLDDLVDITAKTYSKEQILDMEILIFSSLKYQMGRPTPSQFLRRYGRAGKVNIVVYSFAKYFIDLALVSYAMCHIPPSLLAASALYLALFISSDDLSADVWTPTLKYYSQYTWTYLEPVVCKLAALVVHAPKSKHQTVHKKYLDPKRLHSVSARPELKSDKILKLANLI